MLAIQTKSDENNEASIKPPCAMSVTHLLFVFFTRFDPAKVLHFE
jgi:hypothetical protein